MSCCRRFDQGSDVQRTSLPTASIAATLDHPVCAAVRRVQRDQGPLLSFTKAEGVLMSGRQPLGAARLRIDPNPSGRRMRE